MTLIPESENVKSAVSYDLHLDYRTHASIMVKLSGGRFETETKGFQNPFVNPGYLVDGDYSLVWIEGSFLLIIKTVRTWPYVGFGAGYYISEVALSRGAQEYFEDELNADVTQDIDDIPSLHVRAGVNWKLHSRLYLYLDAKYIFLRPTSTLTATDLADGSESQTEYKVDLNTFQGNIGVSIGF